MWYLINGILDVVILILFDGLLLTTLGISVFKNIEKLDKEEEYYDKKRTERGTH